jgi:outer membrane lipoprotein-sorting protein
VKSPETLRRHPALRWVAPLGVACVVTAVAVSVANSGGSPHALPDTVPASLVAAVEHTEQTPFTATMVSRLSSGLPSLPAASAVSHGGGASFESLLTGSHTMQIWYGGRAKQRVALLAAGEETDLFRDGDDLWQWSSSTGVALHTVLRGRARGALAQLPPEALTPAALAARAFSSLNARTGVRIDQDIEVADRRAYDLVLTPHDSATRVGSVHVAVDGITKVPLGVQVYARGSSSAAIDVAFTSIRFGAPSERNFDFVPPPNAAVTELGRRLTAAPSASRVVAKTVGSGWTAVYRLGTGGANAAPDIVLAFRNMPAVSGRWGKGRLLVTGLVSVLVTKDGRMYAGAVQPQRLYAVAAATTKK